MIEFMVFLVFLIPNTEKPAFALMAAYPTAKECNEVLARAPDGGKQWACIKMELKPKSEGPRI